MSSHYTLIRYTPDPIAGEQINVGIAAWGEDGFYARFVRSWRRIIAFAGEDLTYLREFARAVEESTSRTDALPITSGAVTPEVLTAAAASWMNAIQLTTPRFSLLSSRQVVDDLARRVLREPERRARGRDRRWARARAVEALLESLSRHGVADASNYVRTGVVLEGKVERHEYDIVVGNGTPALGAIAVSFQVKASAELRRDVDAAAWLLDDVHTAHPDLDLAAVLLPPQSGVSKEYERASRVFDAIGASVVPLDDADTWAHDAADRHAGHLQPH